MGHDQATVAFTISFSGSDPQNVALVTNTLASFYIEENSKARERQAVGTAQFLRVQLEEMKKKLDEQERQVSEFKERYIGELPQQQEANLATLERLNMQLRLNGDNQIRTSERRAALAKQLAEVEGVCIHRWTRWHRRADRSAACRTDTGAGGAPDAFQRQIPGRDSSEIRDCRPREQLRNAKSNKGPGKETAAPPSPYVLQLSRLSARRARRSKS